jgi:hypothetical protein
MAARFGSRYGELDEEIAADNGSSPRPADGSGLAAMDPNEASKHLFGQVDWDEFLRTGVYLSQSEVDNAISFSPSISSLCSLCLLRPSLSLSL